jgi:hypothetical protein
MLNMALHKVTTVVTICTTRHDVQEDRKSTYNGNTVVRSHVCVLDPCQIVSAVTRAVTAYSCGHVQCHHYCYCLQLWTCTVSPLLLLLTAVAMYSVTTTVTAYSCGHVQCHHYCYCAMLLVVCL